MIVTTVALGPRRAQTRRAATTWSVAITIVGSGPASRAVT